VLTWRLRPGAFLQSNYGAFDALCAALAEQLPPGCKLVDFDAGTGPLGAVCARSRPRRAARPPSRCTPAAAAPLAASVARMAAARGVPRRLPRDATCGVRGDATALPLLLEGDALIVDPPRGGLDAALLAALRAAPAGRGPARASPRCAYVSCGYEALERDADAHGGWLGAGGERRAFSFFPGTDCAGDARHLRCGRTCPTRPTQTRRSMSKLSSRR
jgi:tRNA/tmRNA/rRNA uracil-C5-methylase (TrmA/RlmC/RlmD family)